MVSEAPEDHRKLLEVRTVMSRLSARYETMTKFLKLSAFRAVGDL